MFDRDRAKAKEVSFREFIPPNNGAWTQELSVSRTIAFSEDQVWAYGDEHVAAATGRTIYGRADFEASGCAKVIVDSYRLSLERDEPPIRHCKVIGWPAATERETRKSLALELRRICNPELVAKPD